MIETNYDTSNLQQKTGRTKALQHQQLSSFLTFLQPGARQPSFLEVEGSYAQAVAHEICGGALDRVCFVLRVLASSHDAKGHRQASEAVSKTESVLLSVRAANHPPLDLAPG